VGRRGRERTDLIGIFNGASSDDQNQDREPHEEIVPQTIRCSKCAPGRHSRLQRRWHYFFPRSTSASRVSRAQTVTLALHGV